MLYCNVLPVGQGVPEGNVNEPPLTTQPGCACAIVDGNIGRSPGKCWTRAATPLLQSDQYPILRYPKLVKV